MGGVVNKENNYFFLHVPKTAGRAIMMSLKGMDGSVKINPSKSERSRGVIYSLSHIEKILTNVSYIERLFFHKGYKNQKIDAWRKLFKFCFVRDPYARAYSAYTYCMRNAMDKRTKQYFGKTTPQNLTFSEFIRLPYDYNHEIMVHYHVTQMEWIYSFTTKMDFIGKFENFIDDYLEISKILNIKFTTLRKINISKYKKPLEEIYSNDDKIIIENKFRDDFLNFGYKMTSK